jgi:amino acid transporter
VIGGRRPLRGRRPGDVRVEVERPHAGFFRYTGPGQLTAREAASRLAIFASDNISSSAYATEEIMRVLILAGAAALTLTLPITIAIVVVLAIVVTSYRQTIAAYPNGGGSYIVASDNLGPLPGLTAAAALLVDYVLTVAVSVAAGVAALTSIFPELFEQRVVIALVLVVVIALVNLRGVRESGLVFAIPTYVYIVSILSLLAFGFLRYATGTMPEPLTVFLILRAFSSGSVALTGTEAVSNGVPAFKPPEPRNAQIVITLMGGFFALIFLGMSFLTGQLGILPDPTEQETVVSQLTRTFVGAGTPFHLLIQFATALLLVLAANTSFNGFPRLASILARDGFLPRAFQYRGDRLAFNTGIVLLTVVAVALLAAFAASVTALIPLYTVGVFIAFTLSQSGMVRHWWKQRADDRGWRRRAVINGIGAATTGVVAIQVAATKFLLGAWIVLILIPLLIAVMLFIQRQYRASAEHLAVRPDFVVPPLRREERAIVPVPGINRAVIQAVNVARSIAPDIRAVMISDEPDEAAKVRERWQRQMPDVPLVVVESPYRALVGPLLAYLDVLDRSWPEGKEEPITFVVIPEYVARSWWERILYNQSAKRLRSALVGRPHTVVVNVPYRREEEPEEGAT